MYSTSVRTSMVIDNQKEPRIEQLHINVDGYENKQESKNSKNYYTYGEFGGGNLRYYERSWRAPLWHVMFYDMLSRMKKWKYRGL